MEFPTSTYSWYMNKQSSDTVLRERNDMLNAILIEAKVIYNDGKRRLVIIGFRLEQQIVICCLRETCSCK